MTAPDEGIDKNKISRDPIIISNDVWITSNIVIGSGVTIGDGAVFGANSVVLRDIPPYVVAVGAPARVVGYRFNAEVVSSLLKLKWWEWNDENIMRNRDLFLSPLSEEILNGAQ